MTPNTTKTIVQKLDDEGNVVSEVITTVEKRPVETPDEHYGLYL